LQHSELRLNRLQFVREPKAPLNEPISFGFGCLGTQFHLPKGRLHSEKLLAHYMHRCQQCSLLHLNGINVSWR